jgi:hypothetical protein
MTISSTSSFELTVDQLLTTSLRLAGLLGAGDVADPAHLALGRTLMGMEMDALQAEGVVLRKIERTTLPIIAGTESYTLDADTIEVVRGPDNVAGTIVNSANTETRVTAMTTQDYVATISDKTTTSSQATFVVIERQANVTLTFWPVPDTNVTFRYAKVRLPRDSDPGNATVDIARRWQKALCFGMAWQLAQSLNGDADAISRLQGVAEAEKRKAKNTEVEAISYQLVPMGYR